MSGRNVGATPTPNHKGAETPAPIATPILPYTFPTTWQMPSGSPAGVASFAFAPTAPHTGFACSGMPDPTVAGSHPEIDVTHDGGTTWAPLRTSPLASGQRCYHVFIDPADANDLFVESSVPWQQQPSQTTAAIWRSRDGGASWRQLASPDLDDPVMVDNLVIAGGRLVVSLSRDGAGILPYYLLGSADGGATWKPLGQSLLSQKSTYGPVYGFGPVLAAGSTLYADIGVNCSGGCIEVTPAPGQAPPGEYRSMDAGVTWQAVSIPGTIAGFARAASGAYYGLALQSPDSGNGPVTPYWSRDGGATWKALPPMAGVAGGYIDPTTLGAGGLAIAPDGTIVAGALHRLGSNQITPAGLFYLRATDPAPMWRPLVWSDYGNLESQAVATPAGIRFWRIQTAADTGLHLVYVDVP